MEEEVLVIPAQTLQATGEWFGMTLDVERILPRLLDNKELLFRPRGLVETDPNFKQLIPYAVLQFHRSIFVYRRGQKGGEKRLHHLWSMGVGGHISKSDGSTARHAYHAGFLRELEEEVQITGPFDSRIFGLVYDPRTPVGEVHLGVVHVLSLTQPEIVPRDPSMVDGHFMPIEQLPERIDQFESWSQFVAEPLIAELLK